MTHQRARAPHFSSQGPVIWSRVPETTLPQRQVYRAFIYENVVPVGRVKVNPAWLFITLIEKSNVQIFLFLRVSLGHPITVCFAELSFTSLIRISALNPKSRHYVTRAVPCRGRGETTRPPALSPPPPRRVRGPNVNGCLKFEKKQAKRYLSQGNSGGGLSRIPETI